MVWYISGYNASVHTDMPSLTEIIRTAPRRTISFSSQSSWKWINRVLFVGAIVSIGFFPGMGLRAAPQTGTELTTHHAGGGEAPAVATPDKTYGNKAAPIRVEAFTDYQCPGCRALFEQALRPMIEDYVASNKVYLVHHDFPLAMHQYSGQAARWANAAASIGQFSSVESALFDNQPSWSTDGDISKFVAKAMPPVDFERVQAIMKSCTTPAPQAATPGVDPLAKSGHSCSVDQYIGPDIKMGYGIPVNYTPTYVVYYKGKKIVASSDIVTWPVLKQFFDSLLSQ